MNIIMHLIPDSRGNKGKTMTKLLFGFVQGWTKPRNHPKPSVLSSLSCVVFVATREWKWTEVTMQSPPPQGENKLVHKFINKYKYS